MAAANSWEIDGRITILYHCMANLTVYLLKVSNSRHVDRRARYAGKLRRQSPLQLDLNIYQCTRTHSPHPRPWPSHYSPVSSLTLTSSSCYSKLYIVIKLRWLG